MKTEFKFYNHAVRVIISTLSVIFGISGWFHGFFEVLQGNTPTNGLMIYAIGDNQRFWSQGHEPAFTIIPNFLITGIFAMLFSIGVIVWSLWFVHKKHGSWIFLLLYIGLFLVGGGIGQVIFFLISFLFAILIHKPLTFWKKIFNKQFRNTLSKIWLICLVLSSGLILFALEIAIFGFVPMITNPDHITYTMLISLGAGLIIMMLALISGISYDINKQEKLYE